jgi:exodeoxyribonuclease VII large subunit
MSILFDPSQIPVPQDEGPESVWQLTSRIRGLLEAEFPRLWVVGQVSNLKRHTSGHAFFTLKDDRASIRCVVWKSYAGRLPPEMADGLEVEIKGHLSVFDAAGNYQVYVSSLQPRGLGKLEVAFRQLKAKLEAEGLFDPAHKRPLPRFPRCVGVVTSPTGAAVRDIIQVLSRRWPPAGIILAPARVQGEGAAAEIVRGIRNLNRLGGVDVLIVGRGGGSLEDLWPFNEESVARAIYASAAPVVSAVGHETDFSISDFVADVRAPTPSAAAEIVAPDAREFLASLAATESRLARNLRHRLERLRSDLAHVAGHRYFRYPHELVLAHSERVEDLAQRLAAGSRDLRGRLRLRLEQAAGRLAEHAPRAAHEAAVGAVRMLAFRLDAAARALLAHRWKAGIDRLAGRLGDLNPDRVLARGYSRTVLERTGASLTRAADARAGDLLRTHVAEGQVLSRVTGTEATRRAARPVRAASAARPDKPGRGTRRRGGPAADSGPTLFDEKG